MGFELVCALQAQAEGGSGNSGRAANSSGGQLQNVVLADWSGAFLPGNGGADRHLTSLNRSSFADLGPVWLIAHDESCRRETNPAGHAAAGRIISIWIR